MARAVETGRAAALPNQISSLQIGRRRMESASKIAEARLLVAAGADKSSVGLEYAFVTDIDFCPVWFLVSRIIGSHPLLTIPGPVVSRNSGSPPGYR